MFYHLEHHLWPAVPTCHLPRLAERLDAVAPGVRERQVI
jgi:beta-carotene hydroxylase